LNNIVRFLDRVMQPPAGYDPNVSNLPDPGANAVHIKPMMGGGNSTNDTSKATVTILGEPYRVRKSVSFPLEEEEVRLLEAFHVTEKDIPSDILFSFFHALTEYNCEKEQGVLLNPKCEPVRAILRSVLMKKALSEIDLLRGKENLEPLVKLLNEDTLRRRNKFNLAIDLAASAPLSEESLLDKILGGLLRERYKIPIGGVEDEDPIAAAF
jgi:hypothetical protein